MYARFNTPLHLSVFSLCSLRIASAQCRNQMPYVRMVWETHLAICSGVWPFLTASTMPSSKDLSEAAYAVLMYWTTVDAISCLSQMGVATYPGPAWHIMRGSSVSETPSMSSTSTGTWPVHASLMILA